MQIWPRRLPNLLYLKSRHYINNENCEGAVKVLRHASPPCLSIDIEDSPTVRRHIIGFWESGLFHNSCSPPQSFSQLSWAEAEQLIQRIPTSKSHIGNPDRSLVLSHAVLNFHHMCILRRFNSNSAPTIREKKIHW
jgi:hypothetical protein